MRYSNDHGGDIPQFGIVGEEQVLHEDIRSTLHPSTKKIYHHNIIEQLMNCSDSSYFPRGYLSGDDDVRSLCLGHSLLMYELNIQYRLSSQIHEMLENLTEQLSQLQNTTTLDQCIDQRLLCEVFPILVQVLDKLPEWSVSHDSTISLPMCASLDERTPEHQQLLERLLACRFEYPSTHGAVYGHSNFEEPESMTLYQEGKQPSTIHSLPLPQQVHLVNQIINSWLLTLAAEKSQLEQFQLDRFDEIQSQYTGVRYSPRAILERKPTDQTNLHPILIGGERVFEIYSSLEHLLSGLIKISNDSVDGFMSTRIKDISLYQNKVLDAANAGDNIVLLLNNSSGKQCSLLRENGKFSLSENTERVETLTTFSVLDPSFILERETEVLSIMPQKKDPAKKLNKTNLVGLLKGEIGDSLQLSPGDACLLYHISKIINWGNSSLGVRIRSTSLQNYVLYLLNTLHH